MKAKDDLSVDLVRSLFSYDPDTGILRHKGGRKRQHLEGKVAGTERKGYLVVQIAGRDYQVHRIAWVIVHGRWPDNDLDHRFGDKSNNRIAELREATRAQNLRNTKLSSRNTTGFKGVSRDKRRGTFTAWIKIAGKQKFLGSYETAEAAAHKYDEAARIHFGEFARVNFASELPMRYGQNP